MVLLRRCFAGLLNLLLMAAAGVLAGASPSLAQVTEPERASGAPDIAEPAMPFVRGNPLWSVPLGTLTATRERPVFSPGRRPPAAPVVASAPVAPPPPPPAAPVPERPNLSLIGTVRGEAGGIAVFLDGTTQATVRLHTGQSHRGWILHSVDRRAAELRKGDRTETVALVAAAAQQTAGLPAGQQTAALPAAAPPPPALPAAMTGQKPASPRAARFAQPQLPPGALPSPPPPPPPARAPRQPRHKR